MANRLLERFELDRSIIDKLKSFGIQTARDLLSTSSFALMVYLDISLNEAQSIILKISENIYPKPNSALEIYRERSKKRIFLSTGLNELDDAMKGGIPISCISEVCGPPGVGKTQFCLSCTLQTLALNNSDAKYNIENPFGGVIYIDTELKFDSNRLIQMALSKFPMFYSSEYRVDAAHRVDSLLSKVIVSIIV
jgi:RAD51-like protein 1